MARYNLSKKENQSSGCDISYITDLPEKNLRGLTHGKEEQKPTVFALE